MTSIYPFNLIPVGALIFFKTHARAHTNTHTYRGAHVRHLTVLVTYRNSENVSLFHLGVILPSQ